MYRQVRSTERRRSLQQVTPIKRACRCCHFLPCVYTYHVYLKAFAGTDGVSVRVDNDVVMVRANIELVRPTI
jgi:hypothetical protein